MTPESYADGRLLVRTDSTAWATQMKMLAPTSYAASTRCSATRPSASSTSTDHGLRRGRKGRLRVKGRGPRDTYG